MTIHYEWDETPATSCTCAHSDFVSSDRRCQNLLHIFNSSSLCFWTDKADWYMCHRDATKITEQRVVQRNWMGNTWTWHNHTTCLWYNVAAGNHWTSVQISYIIYNIIVASTPAALHLFTPFHMRKNSTMLPGTWGRLPVWKLRNHIREAQQWYHS